LVTRLFWLSDEAWAAIDPQLREPAEMMGTTTGFHCNDAGRELCSQAHDSFALHTTSENDFAGAIKPDDAAAVLTKINAENRHTHRKTLFVPNRASALTPGNVADITVAQAVVAAVEAPKRLIADKAYDAEHFRNWLAQRRINAVIPSTASRRTP
jgi:transposase